MFHFFVHVAVLLASFYLLALVVDDHFVPSLEFISKKFKLSSDVAGATLMAVGSSAPELFIAIMALFKSGSMQSMGAATIVGSAIFNILVIIGASALVKAATLTWQPVIRDLLFYSVCILLLLITFIDGKITLLESSVFLFLYVLYLFSLNIWKKLFPYTIPEHGYEYPQTKENLSLLKKLHSGASKLFSSVFSSKKSQRQYVFDFVLSIVFLATLSYTMVESAVGVATYLNVSPVVIALVILAPGTSIPDLLSSLNVAKKGMGDMAISNAVGSNIFDISVGLGLTWFVAIIFFKSSVAVSTENLFSSIVLLFATVVALLFLLVVRRWHIGRYAGALLIALYIVYILLPF